MTGFDWTGTSVTSIVTGLLTFVAADLTAHSLGGSAARVVLVPGAEVAWDNCQCGQLALVLSQSFPSRRFPQPSTDVWHPCHDTIIVFDGQLSIVRCVPGPQDNGEPPTTASMATAFGVQESDRYVTWSSLNCYLRSLVDANPKIISDYIINETVVVGALGDCAGVQVNFKFSQYITCEC